jgi:hypothetical protein
MYKTDKRLTSNHLTEEENMIRRKEIESLADVSDKAEEIDIDFEKAGLLERIKAKKAKSQKEDESKAEQNGPKPVQQD